MICVAKRYIAGRRTRWDGVSAANEGGCYHEGDCKPCAPTRQESDKGRAAMRVSADAMEGVWNESLRAIVIKRSKLLTPVGYAATLLHEVGHAITGTVDAMREFESVLTGYLGQTSVVAINR